MSGRECKTCDRTQNSSSQQMPCKMETCVDFPMAPQIVAVEHRKDYDVAGFPLELQCLRHRETNLRAGAREWWRMLLERKNRQEWSWDSGGDSGTGLVIDGSRNAI